MNIYIYGNHSFKKEINETLEHSNIKFKIDSTSLIQEIDNLSQLKQTIKDNPHDIYLIDDAKIIKKNSLNTKFKFLIPKDGIEEEFLLDSGIADLSIDSLSEIPKYILRKYDEQKKASEQKKPTVFDDVVELDDKDDNVELDDELALLLAKENEDTEENDKIQTKEEVDNSIGFGEENLDDLFNISDDINFEQSKKDDISSENKDNNLSEISKDEFADIMNFNDDFGLNNISFDYDDEDINNDNKEPKEEDDFLDMDFEEEDDDTPLNVEEEDFFKALSEDKEEDDDDSDNEVFEDLDFLEEIFNKQDKKKKEKEEKLNENKNIEESSQRKESMSNDEFFELDSLSEKDLLDALSYENNGEGSSNKQVDLKTNTLDKNNNTINVTSSSNVDELALLISKLLSNKTLEITIKIKD